MRIANENVYMESKLVDAIDFKNWKVKLVGKLKKERFYLGQPIIYIGPNEFTYRSRYGYNETKVFVDLYAKVKKY